MSMQNARTPLDDMDTAAHAALPEEVILQQWRRMAPVLRGPGLLLRELKLSDAPALMTMLSAEEVGRFISPPPKTVEGFVRFIERTREQRSAGVSICLGVVPQGQVAPVGLFHLRQLEPEFGAAEWGFALGSPYWGGGLFFAAAPLVIDFVFDVLKARRLEARVGVRNGRGNGALRKLGAVQEALLRQSLCRGNEALDQVLWSIVSDDWRALRTSRGGNVH